MTYSALSFVHLEKRFRENTLSSQYSSFKPHLLMMLREAIAGNAPSINSPKAIDEHSLKVIDALRNTGLTEKFFQLTKIFDRTKDIWINEMKRSRDGMKDVGEFTELLLREVRKSFPIKRTEYGGPNVLRHQGTVLSTWIDRNGKWYGFIKRDPDNVFFHSAQNKGLDFNSLRGKMVEYTLSINPKDNSPIAVNVSVV